MTDKIPNPYLLGADGPSALLPARICWLLEVKLGRELAQLRTEMLGVDPQAAYALRALKDAALRHVPPEEQPVAETSEQVPRSEWLSTRQAAETMRVTTPRAVTQAIARGALPAVRSGRNWRVRRIDAENYRATRAA